MTRYVTWIAISHLQCFKDTNAKKEMSPGMRCNPLAMNLCDVHFWRALRNVSILLIRQCERTDICMDSAVMFDGLRQSQEMAS